MKARVVIIDAFWQLYKEKSIKQITVTELMNKAGYHRSVFYQYFRDIYDLLKQEQDAFFEEVDNLWQDVSIEILNENYSTVLIEKINELSLKYDFKVGILLKHNDETDFKNRFNNTLRKNLYNLLKLQENDAKVKLALEVYISGQLESLVYFHRHKNRLDFKDYLEVTKSIFRTCVKQIEESHSKNEEKHD